MQLLLIADSGCISFMVVFINSHSLFFLLSLPQKKQKVQAGRIYSPFLPYSFVVRPCNCGLYNWSLLYAFNAGSFY